MRDSVLVIGAGMMGSGIAAMSALAGNKTVLIDIESQKVQNGIENAKKCMELRRDNGLCTKDDVIKAENLLCGGIKVEEYAQQAKLIVEAIVEVLGSKQELFAKLDGLLPQSVPICSNTSGLRITDIAASSKNKHRMFTTHFWLPAHLVPLVEVVLSEDSDKKMAEEVKQELIKWGKEPVIVNRDLPGQLANRIFQAIIRESIDIVSSGLASAEDVDKAISCGMAMRFPVWGPLKHLDAVGLDLGLSVQNTVLPNICADKVPSDFLKEKVENDKLGVKSKEGFYDWSVCNIEKDIERRNKFIIEAVKICNKLKD